MKMKKSYIIGYLKDGKKQIPEISTKYRMVDILGAIMVRSGINRNNYRVEPGIYAAGNPENTSDVFVTANYKLSFDALRKNLEGINSWILVLDTKGINVWCAAGKGTFGTKELVNRINSVALDKIISHKRIILPQLGATGISAHKIKEETGFNVQYGPVRADDIKAFINAGYRASKEMRKVTFKFRDRIKLIPNDFIYGKYYLLGSLAVIFIISLISSEGITFKNSYDDGITGMIMIFLAYFSGVVITPALLPYIPFRRFALKGFVTGIILSAILFLMNMTGSNLMVNIAWFLIPSAISSFMAMNFTGSSTYTSLSGVRKEMKTALPLQIMISGLGVILLVISKFIN
jgi:hypothetical protein